MAKTPASRILEYIKSNGITQVFVSKKTGISDKVLSSKLKGKTKLMAEDIEIICWALNQPPSEFISPRPPEPQKIGA